MQNLSNIGVIKDILNRHGFTFSKGLGQNFLINPSVCPRMAEMGNAQPGWGVIEIGTGFGVLTVELAQRADKVVCIEIDSRLLPILDETLADFDNIKIINEYIGVSQIEKDNQTFYQCVIHINGNNLVGRYQDKITAAIAYNKAVDTLAARGITKHYVKNYITEYSSAQYHEAYSKINISSRITNYVIE